ncbi:loganic acid O-methyltransferase-like [Salvia miltiorrhiza]|uniref:loganic acid O-methyltransferase-like n=1 Tax=Salvia miltiorrhiza TaxID=226208 RepID=UPI0025ACF5B8|nr:loganic acid O-methyltransferase-like [Salvia miltiorrhiza]
MGESFPMKGGDGAHSYAKNSQYQKEASDSVKEMIREVVVEKLDTESMSSRVTIADLGCSVGPNTFFAVENLMEAVQTKSCSKNKVEFQVFFNDHSANDFNTLFASLPPGRQYHAAGVPGSFHGRLFPRNSITLAHSSYALQWLSKPPQGVRNEGRIHGLGAPEEVGRAYSDQFEKDLGDFMSARAEEIVSGGLMFLLIPAAPEGVSQTDPTVIFDFYGYTLMDLAKEGVVEKSAIDAFNLPIHMATIGEVRKVVEKNGSFSMERIELSKGKARNEEALDAANVLAHMRAGMEGVFSAHFGASVAHKMFTNVLRKAPQISECFQALHNTPNQIFLVLTRK